VDFDRYQAYDAYESPFFDHFQSEIGLDVNMKVIDMDVRFHMPLV